MARAVIDPDELNLFRSENQRSELMLAIIKPAVVFKAQVAQSFTMTDLVTSVTFDNPDLDYSAADVVAGMTVRIGSLPGAKDLGICRLRAIYTDSIIVGRTSDIAWADNIYITVVNEHAIWAKQAWWKNNTAYMDDDVIYTDQMEHPNPVVVMGPDAILELSGATVDFIPTAAYSWTLEGTMTYAWDAPGASATDGMTNAVPTYIRYNACGTYMVSCTTTGSNGKISTGYRVVYVWNDANPPATQFQIDSLQGDASAGGWSFNVTMFEGAALDTVYDRAKVILFSRDWYGNTKINVGPLSNIAYDSIIATGWIAGETIQWNPEQSLVQFQVQGAQWWLDRVSAFAPGVVDIHVPPVNWSQYEGLTVDAGLWHFLYWRSTVCEMMDVYLTGDTRRTASIEAPAGSLWSQIKMVAEAKLAAEPIVDALGRLIIEIDSQWLPLADRNGLPIIMDITTADWTETADITRQTLPNIAMFESGGFYYSSGKYIPVMAAAFGNNFKPFGMMDKRQTFALTDMADCATWAGLGIGAANIDYPHVILKLGAFIKLIDIAPRQYVTASVGAGDTPRGITWNAQKLIVRTVQYIYNSQSGQILTELDCESASVPGTGVNVPIPNVKDTTTTINDFPPLPFLPPLIPPYPFFPPTPYIPPGPITDCITNYFAAKNEYGIGFDIAMLTAGNTALSNFACTIRSSTTYYGCSYLVINATWYGDSLANVSIYATVGGSPAIEGTYLGNGCWMFYTSTAQAIDGFAIILAAGGESDDLYWANNVTQTNDGYGGSWNGTLNNVLGPENNIQAGYTIPGFLGSSWITVTFGREFPNGGEVTLYGGPISDTGITISALKNGSIVGGSSDNPATFTIDFDGIYIHIDPPPYGTAYIDAISVSLNSRRIDLNNGTIHNICEA